MTSANFSSVISAFGKEQLAYLAILQQQNPEAFKAVTEKSVHPMCALMAQGGQTKAEPPKVGDLVKDRGVYLGKYAGLDAYAADDVLRDKNGKQLLLTFNEAHVELTRRNGGWQAGNGTEAALLREIAKGGKDIEGKLVLPPLELLNGRNGDGTKVCPGENIFDLLDKPALSKVKATISNGKDDDWAVSSSEHPVHTSAVCHVRLSDGGDGWGTKPSFRSGVVPVRLYPSGECRGGHQAAAAAC